VSFAIQERESPEGDIGEFLKLYEARSCGNLFQIYKGTGTTAAGSPWWFLTPLETKIRIMSWGNRVRFVASAPECISDADVVHAV
jgi:hypothetical protein